MIKIINSHISFITRLHSITPHDIFSYLRMLNVKFKYKDVNLYLRCAWQPFPNKNNLPRTNDRSTPNQEFFTETTTLVMKVEFSLKNNQFYVIYSNWKKCKWNEWWRYFFLNFSLHMLDWLRKIQSQIHSIFPHNRFSIVKGNTGSKKTYMNKVPCFFVSQNTFYVILLGLLYVNLRLFSCVLCG